MPARESDLIRQRDARLAARTPGGVLRRALLRGAGNFLANTPLFLLPGRLDLKPKHRVLDLAGGGGAALRFLSARTPFDAPPVLLDSSDTALALARREADPARPYRIVAGRPTRLPFAAGTFDLVLAAGLFRGLGDEGLLRLMMEAERVLRPGGVLAGWDIAPASSARVGMLHRRFLADEPRLPRPRDWDRLAEFITAAGFDDIERLDTGPVLFPPVPHVALLAQKSTLPAPEELRLGAACSCCAGPHE